MAKSKGSGVHVALLRGINVGGKNKLPMKELARMFTDLGCEGVRTYIQSGNVVFRAGDALARRTPQVISKQIEGQLGLRVPVVTRTAAELAKVAAGNPFLDAGADVSKLHVAFLADKPAASKIALLDPSRSPPDELVVRGREVYLHLPNGVARSKLTNAYFDSRLGTTSTMRNWKTVLTLLELTASA